jgi:hypothetical protein
MMVWAAVLDSEVLAFIRKFIRSTWALEALLLLRHEAPRPLSKIDLVRTLRATPSLVGRCLDQLSDAGLITLDEAGEVRYAPASPGLGDLCNRLVSANAEHPLAVRDAIRS